VAMLLEVEGTCVKVWDSTGLSSWLESRPKHNDDPIAILEPDCLRSHVAT
jgi:hypothetical protein